MMADMTKGWRDDKCSKTRGETMKGQHGKNEGKDEGVIAKL